MTRPSQHRLSLRRGQGVCVRERDRAWGGRGVVEALLSNSCPHALLSTTPWGWRSVLRHELDVGLELRGQRRAGGFLMQKYLHIIVIIY